MEYFTLEYLFWAVALGGISAASLPLGSFLGLRYNPGPFVISILAAFGAGALIAALTIELIAPSVFALTEAPKAEIVQIRQNFYALITGAIIGGVLFIVLDQLNKLI